METKNMIGGIVSLAVVVICVAAIMMPVLSDATKTTETFTNEGYFYLDKVTDDSTVTIEFEYTNPQVLTVNNEEFNMGGEIPGDVTVALTDNSFLRYQYGARCTLYTADSSYGARAADQQNLTIVASNGSMTISVTGSDDATITYNDLYCITDEGDYVMKKSTESVYIAEDATFFGAGRSTIGTSAAEFLQLSGSIEDGATFTTLNGSENTFTTPVVDATAVDGYEGLYKLTKVTTTATNSTGSSDLTYSYFIVPAEVTAELSQHLAAGEIALLNAIPALVIVAIVIGALGIAITSRRD